MLHLEQLFTIKYANPFNVQICASFAKDDAWLTLVSLVLHILQTFSVSKKLTATNKWDFTDKFRNMKIALSSTDVPFSASSKPLTCFRERPGVNFINVLHTAFTLVDPESVLDPGKICPPLEKSLRTPMHLGEGWVSKIGIKVSRIIWMAP